MLCRQLRRAKCSVYRTHCISSGIRENSDQLPDRIGTLTSSTTKQRIQTLSLFSLLTPVKLSAETWPNDLEHEVWPVKNTVRTSSFAACACTI